MHILLTGGAGFIGSHLATRLLKDGHEVTIVDDFNDFYDPGIKESNIANLTDSPSFRLVRADIRNFEAIKTALPGGYQAIIHLAARAGVRPSISDPLLYQQVNVQGTQHLLELAKAWGVCQFVFASSSSVYGVNPNVPWREDDAGLLPISPYASTKLSGEFLGHVYSHLYGIRFVGLRFFTVYGPRQRPDLAIHKFARMILQGRPIPFFGDGSTSRDYTFVDDTVSGILGALHYDRSPFEIFNLGNDSPVSLKELVEGIENVLGHKARIEHLPDQPGDVPHTRADIEKARRLLDYEPMTPLRDGLEAFKAWLTQTV